MFTLMLLPRQLDSQDHIPARNQLASPGFKWSACGQATVWTNKHHTRNEWQLYTDGSSNQLPSQVFFKARPLLNIFKGRFPRWFWVTNHLARQVTLNLAALASHLRVAIVFITVCYLSLLEGVSVSMSNAPFSQALQAKTFCWFSQDKFYNKLHCDLILLK